MGKNVPLTETLVEWGRDRHPMRALRLLGPEALTREIGEAFGVQQRSGWSLRSLRWTPPVVGTAPILGLGLRAAFALGFARRFRAGIWTHPAATWIAWMPLPGGYHAVGVARALRTLGQCPRLSLDIDMDRTVPLAHDDTRSSCWSEPLPLRPGPD
jgi:hypothetical protein